MSNQWPSPFQPVAPPPPPPPALPPQSGPSTGIKILVGGLAIAVVLLVGVIFAYVWAGSGPAPTASATPTQVAAASSPPPTTSSSAPPTSPPASETPTATDSALPTNSPPRPTGQSSDIAAQVEAVMSQVPPIRELDELRDVPFDIVSRDEFRDLVEQNFEDSVDPVALAAQQRALQRLGLLPDDADLKQMLVDLNAGGAAAYYRYDTQTMYVIDNGTPFDAFERYIVSHEYTHALQDQHFETGKNTITDLTEGDAATAQLSAVEGDATWTMNLWAQQNLSFQELVAISFEAYTGTDPNLLASVPPILSRQLSFPYVEGMTFAQGLQQSGGWTAVNDALVTAPASTEQILHPEKYTAHEAPLDVGLKDPTSELGGGGWQQVYLDTFGELSAQVFTAGGEEAPVLIPGLPIGEVPHAEAAAGWSGDRIAMWERDESGSWAIAWSTAWDSKTDADEFATRTAELQSTLDGVSKVIRTSDTEVLLLMASAEPTLQELESALAQ